MSRGLGGTRTPVTVSLMKRLQCQNVDTVASPVSARATPEHVTKNAKINIIKIFIFSRKKTNNLLAIGRHTYK